MRKILSISVMVVHRIARDKQVNRCQDGIEMKITMKLAYSDGNSHLTVAVVELNWIELNAIGR